MVLTILVFILVLTLNVIPIFAPPTWLVLSAIAVYYNVRNILFLALTGAVAATLGRLVLAKLSGSIIRGKLLGEKSKKNIDGLKKHLEKRRALTFGIFLFYAFSPLSSSQLFIAYGLTTLPLKSIALPFFLGRFTSYALLSFAASEVTRRIAYQFITTGSFLGFYFVISQCITIATVYLFVKIDWHALLAEKKLRLVKE